MAKGDKPVVKLYGKRKNNAPEGSPEYADIGAFWVSDDGKGLSGMWSRDVVAIKIRDRAGKEHVIKPEHYFCNLRDDRDQVPMSAISGAVAKAKAAAASNDAPPDFGDDDIPF